MIEEEEEEEIGMHGTEAETDRPTNACPSCGHSRFEVIDAGRLARCSRCRWLLKPDGRGGYHTALPGATRAKPKRSQKVKTGPTDLAALDRLLGG